MGRISRLYKNVLHKWHCLVRMIHANKYKYRYRGDYNMKVNIISPDAKDGWIIYKFGKSVYDELIKMNIDAKLSKQFDPSCDINHFFTPNATEYADRGTTFMITHVDTAWKVEQIRKATKKGAVGICMSRETRDRLIASGIPANRICYINPAQDGQIKPRKITLGFTYRVHSDNRKRDSMVVDICKRINPDFFKFVIMGADWEDIISQIKELGFEVDYYPGFDKQKYNELMVNLDYYCYFGFDEGSMGYLDAVAAGIGTIVTPQGYHLDTECEITYPVTTIDEIVDALEDIENKRKKNLRFIETWTWSNYAAKHLEIWKYMLGTDKLENLLSSRGWYTDGIYSLLIDDLSYHTPIAEEITNAIKK